MCTHNKHVSVRGENKWVWVYVKKEKKRDRERKKW